MLPFGRVEQKPLDRLSLGGIGEEAAARWLAARGYRVLERNVRVGRGEIDIVARQGRELVFVEVKSRSRGNPDHPEESEWGTPAQGVGIQKQRRLARLAEAYIAARLRREVRWRLDIVEVWLTPQGKILRINILPGAFRPQP